MAAVTSRENREYKWRSVVPSNTHQIPSKSMKWALTGGIISKRKFDCGDLWCVCPRDPLPDNGPILPMVLYIEVPSN